MYFYHILLLCSLFINYKSKGNRLVESKNVIREIDIDVLYLAVLNKFEIATKHKQEYDFEKVNVVFTFMFVYWYWYNLFLDYKNCVWCVAYHLVFENPEAVALRSCE